MPIQGSIEDAGLADVMQVLSMSRRSGCIAVADGVAHGEIYLDAGVITYAAVTNRRDRALELLPTERGQLTVQLAEALVDQGADGEPPLGRILLESGRVPRADVEELVRTQVEEAVYLICAWTTGEFTFTSGVQPPANAVLVALDATNLLLESARRIDEWKLIRRKIPTFDLVYQRSSMPAAHLTADQERLVRLLDGTRDVTRLIAQSGLGDFQAAKALYGLLMAGVVELVERRAHIRHLDYRALLAYVVHEAEFADPAHRREAARHVADCRECGERLRAIHVRRTSAATGEFPELPMVR